ncbi:MAG TPA: GyrI-like domain-containing protein [Chloroflexota bacterium]
MDEGECVQALHVGPYAIESGIVQRMDELVRDRGLEYRGRHHEIYISDPRRVQPEQLRTILRHPVS